MLSLSNFVESIGNLISLFVYQHETSYYVGCYVQAFLLQFSSIASFGWFFAIAINLYSVVVKNTQKPWMEIAYHVAVWGFALIASVVPFSIPHSYGIAGL